MPKKARKVGRPKLPKGTAKGRIVPVRFTADDMKSIEKAAKFSDKTVSDWVRAAVHSVLTSRRLIEQSDTLLKQADELLGRSISRTSHE